MIMFDSVVLSKTFFLRETFFKIKNKKLKLIDNDMQTLWLTVCADKRCKMKGSKVPQKKKGWRLAFRIM